MRLRVGNSYISLTPVDDWNSQTVEKKQLGGGYLQELNAVASQLFIVFPRTFQRKILAKVVSLIPWA